MQTHATASTVKVSDKAVITSDGARYPKDVLWEKYIFRTDAMMAECWNLPCLVGLSISNFHRFRRHTSNDRHTKLKLSLSFSARAFRSGSSRCRILYKSKPVEATNLRSFPGKPQHRFSTYDQDKGTGEKYRTSLFIGHVGNVGAKPFPITFFSEVKFRILLSRWIPRSFLYKI